MIVDEKKSLCTEKKIPVHQVEEPACSEPWKAFRKHKRFSTISKLKLQRAATKALRMFLTF